MCRVLAAGLSSVVFAAATLAITSVVLLVLQRPWNGKGLGARQAAKVVVQSLLLGSSFVLWAGGLLLCGPATTVMLEYTEVMLLRMGRSISSRGGRGRSARLIAAGKPLGVLASICILLAWEGLGRHTVDAPSGLGNSTMSARLQGGGPRRVVRQPWNADGLEWAGEKGRHIGGSPGDEQAGHPEHELASVLAPVVATGAQAGAGSVEQDIPAVPPLIAHELALADLGAAGASDGDGRRREWEDLMEDRRREETLFLAEEAAGASGRGAGGASNDELMQAARDRCGKRALKQPKENRALLTRGGGDTLGGERPVGRRVEAVCYAGAEGLGFSV